MATNDPEDWPDVEGALRTYLRANADINAQVGTRVFFGVPRDSASSFPMIMLTRIGGGEGPGDVPLDNALMQFDVYGKKAEEGGGRKECTDIARALRKAFSTIRGRTRLDSTVVGFDPRISTMVYSPLPGDDRPRYLITGTFPCIYSPE